MGLRYNDFGTNGGPQKLAKIRVFKIDYIYDSSNTFSANIEISGTKWVENTPIYIFLTFGQKINKSERKKLEKNEKIPKTYKLQAIILTSNSKSK